MKNVSKSKCNNCALSWTNHTPAQEVGTVTANISLNDNVLKLNAVVTDRLIYNENVAVRQKTTAISLGL